MSNLDCNTVKDLLPIYVEGLVSDETANDIKEHLSECEECLKLHKEMTAGENFKTENTTKEINYLKKIKRKTKIIVVSVLAILLVFSSVSILANCVIGKSETNFGYYMFVDENKLELSGSLLSSFDAVSKVSATSDGGNVKIDVRRVLPFFYHSGEFELRFEAEENIKKIETADGFVLWQDGTEIDRKTNEIFNSKVKYVGNNSAVSKLLRAIDLKTELNCSDYSIRLLTAEAPYGLEISGIVAGEYMSDRWYSQTVEYLSLLILSCVDNLDYVTFDYVSPNKIENSYTMTTEDANKRINDDVKKQAKDIKTLQKFINDAGYYIQFKLQIEYKPHFEELGKDILTKLNNNPIDEFYFTKFKKQEYLDIATELELLAEWGEAYEKQYKTIHKALTAYAEKSSNEYLLEILEKTKNDYKTSDNIAGLFYRAEEEILGWGTGRPYISLETYLQEIRNITLELAECAYFLRVDFEWIV